jgi:hypothetical protein
MQQQMDDEVEIEKSIIIMVDKPEQENISS